MIASSVDPRTVAWVTRPSHIPTPCASPFPGPSIVRLEELTHQEAALLGLSVSVWAEYLDVLAPLRAHCAETYAHSLRVGFYAARLATAEGLDAELALFGGSGHDLGKCAISNDVLHAEQFGPEERGIVQEHPIIGQALLAPVNFEASLVAGTHHQFQANPYGINLSEVAGPALSVPDRTRIVSIGQLVSVCDAFDAASTRTDHSPDPTGTPTLSWARTVLSERGVPSIRTEWLVANALVTGTH